MTPLPDDPYSAEIDELLEYVLIQFRKPVPSDIREEVVNMGDKLVLSELKHSINQIVRKARLETMQALHGEAFKRSTIMGLNNFEDALAETLDEWTKAALQQPDDTTKEEL